MVKDWIELSVLLLSGYLRVLLKSRNGITLGTRDSWVIWGIKNDWYDTSEKVITITFKHLFYSLFFFILYFVFLWLAALSFSEYLV
jgi:hypothetical protein